MGLDIRLGILSIVKILIYIPILFPTFRTSRKYGLRETQWIFLFLFSLIRVIDSMLMIAMDENSPSYAGGLWVAGYALDASAFSFLLLCTLGLLETISEGPSRKYKRFRNFRVFTVYFSGIAALGVIIAGVAGTVVNGMLLFTGACFYIFLWALSVIAVVVLWILYGRLLEYRKKLLAVVSLSLPFLTVRTVYTVLSVLSWSGVPVAGGQLGDGYWPFTGSKGSNIIQYNIFSGEWQIYLGMSVLMEYAVVIIYTVAGTMLPLDEDYERQEIDEFSLHNQRYRGTS